MPKEKGRRKWPDKHTEEYTEKREQNNVAVRKSREKAKQKQQETKARVEGLKVENVQLENKVEILKKELSVLKDLFTAHASGAAPPTTHQAPADVKPDVHEVEDSSLIDHLYSNHSSKKISKR